MTLKDLIDIFDATAAQQTSLWNIYWVVAIALLGFLWNEPRERRLKVVLIVAFLLFAFSNLFVLQSLQSNLVVIAESIDTHLNLLEQADPESGVPPEFIPALRKDAFPLAWVIAFHLAITTAACVAMGMARSRVG